MARSEPLTVRSLLVYLQIFTNGPIKQQNPAVLARQCVLHCLELNGPDVRWII
uniref:hypothetical protein n=1 Tax=Pararhizobium sp. IMCC3301 TaxID=3067904 RepID=UPI002741B818|nr:hypothetical protein [Pararhizobium sp. IMCC3301]